ncbi:MAG: threonine synthase [Oscillospiraceae bacterium]|jgi:threonine synthase|nr:threonine synthase [Oscillospiraceae bacterium]
MNYKSTRNSQIGVSAAAAIAGGISAEGGLYVPQNLPRLDESRLDRLIGMDYRRRASDILGDFLTDFTEGEITACANAAYGAQFDSPHIAPIAKLSPDVYMLELWHGPTCAFKDMALQLLPHLLTRSVAKTAGGKTIDILVATSGDTGKAALEGFKDVPGTNILVFYPEVGVSEIQKRQMTSQEGKNVNVCGVRGNFDDTQTAVKGIFTDKNLTGRLAARNAMFSSANSINWGRLAPQIVYYVSAWCDLVAGEEIARGDTVNICVPTGNFGNILAAYYAKRMGLPIGRLICASNINKVLTDFISTGVYDRRREFHATSSPSMDILISSNLERLLFALTGEDSAAVSAMMEELSASGSYSVPQKLLGALQDEFYGGSANEEETLLTVRETFDRYGYLCDTHTAVALKVHGEYVRRTGDSAKTIIASTASPFKFAGSILKALTGEASGPDEFERMKRLAEITGTEPPPQLMGLRDKHERFLEICDKDEMCRFVCSALEI